MSIRPTRPSDRDDLGLDWLLPADELGDEGTSLVEEVGGHVVAAGLRRFTTTGARQDAVELHCERGHGGALLRELARAADRPILLRVIPGTPSEDAATQAGGRVVQSVPAAYFDTSHPDVQAWAHQQLDSAELAGLRLESGVGLDMETLLDMWMSPYLRMHEGWAPTQDVQAMRESFRRRFTATLDRQRTAVTMHGEERLAAVFAVGPFDGVLMPILVEIEPQDPHCEVAARAAIATTLTQADPLPVEFDGHADEPTFMSILEEIPQRSSGTLTPMNLVEIS